MESKWKVIYFTDSEGNNPVSEFLDSLDERQQTKILRILHNIR